MFVSFFPRPRRRLLAFEATIGGEALAPIEHEVRVEPSSLNVNS